MSEISEKFAALQGSKLRLRNSSASERTKKIMALWKATLARKDDLIAATYKERKSHDLDLAAELMMIKGESEFFEKNLHKWMKPEKIKNSMATFGKRCEVRRQSKGVVLNIAAYNAPTAEAIVPAIAAISAGNAVAIKTSEYAPHSAQIIQEIFEAALPADEAQVFQGGVEVAQELLSLPFDHIYYTGGTTVGKIVMRAAADNLASVTLEMGGKSPVIVDKSAKLENAAAKIALGRCLNAGQVCIAPEYVIIHESVKDEFLALVKEKIEGMYNSDGKGIQSSEYFPRIINDGHFGRIKGLIDDAKKKGAEVITGGEADVKDRYIAPTVLADVSEDMAVMQEEVFGPVLTVSTFSTREEVLDMVEKRPNPLALYIYATDQDFIEYFLTNTSSGSAVVNNNVVQSGTNPNLPFGGIGTSGQGRIGGRYGFEAMSNERSIVHQPLDRFRDFLINMPPYSERYTNIINKALR